MTITKQDFTHLLVDTVGLTGRDSLHEKRARPGRNPKTGKPFEIAARRVVTLLASLIVKARCGLA